MGAPPKGIQDTPHFSGSPGRQAASPWPSKQPPFVQRHRPGQGGATQTCLGPCGPSGPVAGGEGSIVDLPGPGAPKACWEVTWEWSPPRESALFPPSVAVFPALAHRNHTASRAGSAPYLLPPGIRAPLLALAQGHWLLEVKAQELLRLLPSPTALFTPRQG